MSDQEAFTVGYAKSYDAALKAATLADPVIKVGAHDDYDGGWVWHSSEEARTFLTSKEFSDAFPGRDPAEFDVYRLELPIGWHKDVSPKRHGRDDVHRLLNDAHIVERYCHE